MSLIETILIDVRARLAERKQRRPQNEIQLAASTAPRGRIPFRSAIESRRFSIVAEVKAKSPSSGPMDAANVSNALVAYDAAPSVSAVSILTNEDHFGNTLEDLRFARRQTTKPILRKDFIIDEYQVWEARAYGADAILIMALLHADEPARAGALVQLARSVGMDVLFELGTGASESSTQLGGISPEDVIWGVNSRRFETSKLMLRSRLGSVVGKELSTDTSVHSKLWHLIPEKQTAIAESGIHEPAQLRSLMKTGYRGALIGTAFLRKGSDLAQVVANFDAEVARLSAASAEGTPEWQHPSGLPSRTA